jgi:hypothetical protein
MTHPTRPPAILHQLTPPLSTRDTGTDLDRCVGPECPECGCRASEPVASRRRPGLRSLPGAVRVPRRECEHCHTVFLSLPEKGTPK